MNVQTIHHRFTLRRWEVCFPSGQHCRNTQTQLSSRNVPIKDNEWEVLTLYVWIGLNIITNFIKKLLFYENIYRNLVFLFILFNGARVFLTFIKIYVRCTWPVFKNCESHGSLKTLLKLYENSLRIHIFVCNHVLRLYVCRNSRLVG